MHDKSKENRFRDERRSGIDWHIAYEGDGRAEMPVAAYVEDKSGRIAIGITADAGHRLFHLEITDIDQRELGSFDEALDCANGYILSLPAQAAEPSPYMN